MQHTGRGMFHIGSADLPVSMDGGSVRMMSSLAGQLLRVHDLIAAERWDEALRAIGPLRRDHPDVGEVWQCQAQALRGAGHTIEALVAAERWVQVSPGSVEARELHGALEFEYLVKKAREAEVARSEALERLAERGPEPWGNDYNGGYNGGAYGGGYYLGPDGAGATKRTRSHLFGVVAIIVVIALAAAPTLVSRWRTSSGESVRELVWPTPTDEAARARGDLPASGIPNPVKPSSGGSWVFLNEVAGEPVRHDPCTTIHYRVRVGAGPTGAVALVRQSLDRVSDATGLTFVYDGITDEVPQQGTGTGADPDDTLVIAWASPDETDLFSGVDVGESAEAVGVGGPILMRSSDGSEWYVGGFVLIRTDVPVSPGFGPGTSQGNVLMHELGHVVGLGHVEDANELMAPWTTDATREGYGPGDLYGLWRLGAAQGCL